MSAWWYHHYRALRIHHLTYSTNDKNLGSPAVTIPSGELLAAGKSSVLAGIARWVRWRIVVHCTAVLEKFT